MDSWLGYQGDQLGNEVQWFKQDVSGPVAVRCFELVAHCSVAGHRQAFGGYCRPGDVAAKTFQLISFMGPGGNAGMEREPSHLARIDERIVWPAVRQGLQREHFTPLLWSHRNAVGNGPLLRVPAPAALVSPFTSTSQQLVHW